MASYYAAHAWDIPAISRNLDCDNTSWNTPAWNTPTHFSLGSMAGYYTYQEMLDILDQMASLYPDILTFRDTVPGAHTHNGFPVYWIKLSDNPQIDEEEPEVLFTALHHAREPMSLSQLIYFLWHMLEGYGSDPEITYLINETELYFIPCLNPDGYRYNELTNPSGGGLWRKNRRYNEEDGSYGVDLNRNYAFGWGYDDVGSSPAPASSTYRGPAPLSEPETQAAAAFCKTHKFQLALNYHSYGNVLIYPWSYSDTETTDTLAFRGFSEALTRENFYRAGTGTQTVGYVVNGDSDDWMYGETGEKPAIFSMTPEVGPGNFGFWPPVAQIEPLCQGTLRQNLTALHLPLVYGLATDQSNWVFTQSAGELPFSLKRYGLQDGPLTASLAGLSSEILSTSNAQTFDLPPFQSGSGSFQYLIDPATPAGASLNFLLTVSNGVVSWSDTLHKIYQPGPMPIWTDASEEPAVWSNTGSWGWTTEHFKSPPRSWTDSPASAYAPNTYQELTSEPFHIDTAEYAFLSFWARWDIETNYDYVQFQALNALGNVLAPLCGRYTNSGVAPFQPIDDPLYDGFQGDWVEEVIDLSDYIGQVIRIRVVLASDQGVQGDGFYIDNMELVRYLASETVHTNQLPVDLTPAFTVSPNPASDNFQIRVQENLEKDHSLTLVVTDLHGKRWLTHLLSSPLENISAKELPTGWYGCFLVSDEKWLGVQRLVIQR
ncbi:MAG: immune inhibitor A [Saprospirales bacterium]|nr:immune inhibitor A [Saprospirales bacterium]